MTLFVDTWGWLSLADPQEAGHASAAREYRKWSGARAAIVTSDYVLDEMMTALFAHRPFESAWQFVQGILDGASEGTISMERMTEARFHRALMLRRKFADKPRISFTDLSSMVIMQELAIINVLTADAHFRQVGLGFRVFPD